ncbi:MAG: hypothetical protein H7318_11920 [Oligoflexus sp.]|nr:hypothetical protein [Oligoflexus sp.]
MKTNWYVSGGGTVLDRYEKVTKLTLAGAGSYTLVFTTRAQKSKASAIRFRTVTVN